MRLTSTLRVWQRWQAAAGPWKGWSVCPALLAPEVEQVTSRPERPQAARRLADSLASGLGQGGVLIVVEVEPVLGVHIASLLHARGLANGVLVLPRWPYADAVLPVDRLLHALVGQAPRTATDEQLPNVAFVLDAERQRPLARRPLGDRRADNRYRLSLADLPSLTALRARGIRQILKIR